MLSTRNACICIYISVQFFVSQFSLASYDLNIAKYGQSKQKNNKSKYDPRAPRYFLSILVPMSFLEFKSYSETMKLDEAQIAFAEVLLDEYRNKFKTRKSELCIPIWQRSAELLANRPNLDELTHAEAHSILITDGRKAQSQLVKLENELFNEIESFLVEDQLPLLEQVKLQRSRNQMRGFGGFLRVDQVDIIILMRNLPGMEDLEEKQREILNNILLEYDNKITTLWKERHKAALKSTLKVPILKAPLYELAASSTNDPSYADAIDALDQNILKKVGRLNRAQIRPGKLIVKLNQQYLKALETVLPQASWKTLHQRYNESAYHPIFPNPFDANHILNTVLELADLSDDQRVFLISIAIAYSSSDRQLEDKMKEQYVSMREVLAEYQRKSKQFKSHQNKLLELDEKRQEISAITIAQINDALLPEQLAAIAKLLDELKQKVTISKKNRDRRLLHS